MNETTLNKLEFDKIKHMLNGFTVSPSGMQLAARHVPSANEMQVRAWLKETEEAANLLATGASIPLSAMEGMEPFIALLGKGKIYTEQELGYLASWLAAVAQMKRYMEAKRFAAPTISGYADSMHDCPELRKELDRCIRHGMLADQASPLLADIRRHIAAVEDRIERRLNQTLGKYKSALQEQIVSKRNGHYVIAVKRELRKQVPGTVWDESASGQTLFVEPVDVAELQAEWQMWKAEEERERTVILSELSEIAEQQAERLRWNAEAMASFDFIFARAKLSRTYDGIPVSLTNRPYIKLVGAKHPLLGSKSVPLDVELGGAWRQLIITGPNTGGKTVALKTIGLLALMVQAGLLVPACKGTEFGLFQHILADVGDGQSIEQSLSTFSAHMASLREMMTSANERSLILLDELAAGTNPDEGIALSIAVLEELLERRSFVAATTHFNEIKRFAAETPACTNARMAFDAETLKPLYRLEIGEAGDSYAFAIARRFGLPERIVLRAEARAAAYRSNGVAQPDNRAADIRKEPTGTNDKVSGTTGSLNAINQSNVQSGKSIGSPSEVVHGTGIDMMLANNELDQTSAKRPFEVGDCVWIYPLKRTGIVFKPANERGEVVVQVQKNKLTFNRKRLSLYIPNHKLYPGTDYDLDIVFESKGNRKTKKLMGRKYVPGLEIVTPPDETQQ
ncbi:DNA mismatch repair protein MutS [Paenibacillus sp. sptzw28]|uniref:endonuclease MutS2 n=1 Tax=Paenibacillus sp. sptzw28 TaxID=715179 RepID=UPI001C6E0E76|nr:DNA mismatch repair protein MutS [Paenibacillus sp. sptzw28]QYR19016.1 DNA mismatch repair protein MutS [Paenibacillus sp. sptzw28]